MNQIITEIERMMPPIFLMNIFPRSHMCRARLFSVGMRYGGNSMMNGADSPGKKSVLKSKPMPMASRMPRKYMEKITVP